jgi:hypothetical protein
MKACSAAVLAGLLLSIVAGCASEPPPLDLRPVPVSPAQAAPRVAGALPERIDGTAVPPPTLRETTPPGVFEVLSVQTFQVTDGLYEFETFAVTEEEVIQIGTGFGGPGIIAFRPVDADDDGNPDLAYAFGSGQSIKRFGVALLDRPGYRPPRVGEFADPATRPAPPAMRVREIDFFYRDPIELRGGDGAIEVWDPARNTRLGRLVGRGGRMTMEVEPDLPRFVRQRIQRR